MQLLLPKAIKLLRSITSHDSKLSVLCWDLTFRTSFIFWGIYIALLLYCQQLARYDSSSQTYRIHPPALLQLTRNHVISQSFQQSHVTKGESDKLWFYKGQRVPDSVLAECFYFLESLPSKSLAHIVHNLSFWLFGLCICQMSGSSFYSCSLWLRTTLRRPVTCRTKPLFHLCLYRKKWHSYNLLAAQKSSHRSHLAWSWLQFLYRSKKLT